jgi:hypothetical protein
MATACRHSHSDARAPERRLAEFFQREIAPRIGSFEAERVEARARFITTAIAFAAAIPTLLYVIWPLDPGWAVLATAVPLAIGVTVLGSQQRKFRHRIRDLIMPAICAAIGDLQHSAGDESAVPFEDLESLGCCRTTTAGRSTTYSRGAIAAPASSWRKPGFAGAAEVGGGPPARCFAG